MPMQRVLSPGHLSGDSLESQLAALGGDLWQEKGLSEE